MINSNAVFSTREGVKTNSHESMEASQKLLCEVIVILMGPMLWTKLPRKLMRGGRAILRGKRFYLVPPSTIRC